MVFSIALVTGCGSSDQQVDLTSARGCLARAGFERNAGLDVEGSLPGSIAPNLAMQKAGISVEAVVDGDVARARRRLADLRGVLQSFGAPDPDLRVTRVGNAVLVFTPAPSREARGEVVSCFNGD